MKATVIIVVSLVTVSVIGITAMQFHQSAAPEESGKHTLVPFSASSDGTVEIAVADESVSAEPVTDHPSPEPDAPRSAGDLELVGFTERRVGGSDDQEKWTWRVEVDNKSQEPQYCDVEVQWLDASGTCLDTAREVRRLAPGVQSITMVHALNWETADQVQTVGVAKLESRPAPNGDR